MLSSLDLKDGFYTLEKTYPVSMSEQDMQYAIKPAALLNFLQDMGARNIDGTPFGRQELLDKGLAWFLVRYRIEFDKYPTGLSEISFKTENRGTLRQTAYRAFEAYDTDGNRLLKAITSWLMVDLNTKSLINIEQMFPEIRKFEKREDDVELRKLKPLSEWDNEKVFHVRYEDLDMNGHVNNTVYMSWAVEALDYEFLSNHTIKAIDIYYKHEVKYGDDILSCVKFVENSTEHVIKNSSDGEDVCLIKIEWS